MATGLEFFQTGWSIVGVPLVSLQQFRPIGTGIDSQIRNRMSSDLPEEQHTVEVEATEGTGNRSDQGPRLTRLRWRRSEVDGGNVPARVARSPVQRQILQWKKVFTLGAATSSFCAPRCNCPRSAMRLLLIVRAMATRVNVYGC